MKSLNQNESIVTKIIHNLPEKSYYSTHIPVKVTDLNYGNHVGNEVYLNYAQEARTQFLHHHGYSELNVAGAGLIMVNASIEYRREIHYPDMIQIDVRIGELKKRGFSFYHVLKSEQKNEIVAFIKNAFLFYDYQNKKVVYMPDEFANLVDFKE